MTEMTTSVNLVALVATAASLPLVLISIFAGANRRLWVTAGKVVLVANRSSPSGGSVMLVALAYAGLADALHICCSPSASSVSAAARRCYGPAWQASVSRSRCLLELLPSAIAPNSISYNIARFSAPRLAADRRDLRGDHSLRRQCAARDIPLIITLLTWKRQEPRVLPPEGLARASGVGRALVMHFAADPHHPVAPVSLVCGGAVGTGVAAAGRPRHPLRATKTFGLCSACSGVGAVIAGINMRRCAAASNPRRRYACWRWSWASALTTIALSPWRALTRGARGDGRLMDDVARLFNISAQFSAPRCGGRARWPRSARRAMAGWCSGGWLWA